MRIFKIYSLTNFQVYNIVLKTIVTLLYSSIFFPTQMRIQICEIQLMLALSLCLLTRLFNQFIILFVVTLACTPWNPGLLKYNRT